MPAFGRYDRQLKHLERIYQHRRAARNKCFERRVAAKNHGNKKLEYHDGSLWAQLSTESPGPWWQVCAKEELPSWNFIWWVKTFINLSCYNTTKWYVKQVSLYKTFNTTCIKLCPFKIISVHIHIRKLLPERFQ